MQLFRSILAALAACGLLFCTASPARTQSLDISHADQAVLDMVFSLEERAFQTKPLTPADIAHDVAYMKVSGMELGPIEKVKPEVTLYQR